MTAAALWERGRRRFPSPAARAPAASAPSGPPDSAGCGRSRHRPRDFSVAARTPIRTGPRSDGPPDLGSATGPSASALSLRPSSTAARRLSRPARCASRILTRGTPAAGQCGSRSRAALGQHGDEIGPVNAECCVPARRVPSLGPARSRSRPGGSTGNQAQLWHPISPRKNPADPLQLAG